MPTESANAMATIPHMAVNESRRQQVMPVAGFGLDHEAIDIDQRGRGQGIQLRCFGRQRGGEKRRD